jgi:hypothetical protein
MLKGIRKGYKMRDDLYQDLLVANGGNPYANVEKTAEFLHCSRSTLDKNRAKGINTPGYIKIGNRVLYSVRDIAEFIMINKVLVLGAYERGSQL